MSRITDCCNGLSSEISTGTQKLHLFPGITLSFSSHHKAVRQAAAAAEHHMLPTDLQVAVQNGLLVAGRRQTPASSRIGGCTRCRRADQ